MNKIRYWRKQLYNANMVYREASQRPQYANALAFCMVCEINDYLFNLEED